MQETLVTITLALRVSKQSEELKLDTGKARSEMIADQLKR
jgi:hypothetical protein